MVDHPFRFPAAKEVTGFFYGADYNPEQWPRQTWVEDMRLMRQAGVNVVSLGIFAWSAIEIGDDDWDFKWMDEIIELLHQNGIFIDLGTSTASPPPWLAHKHPEILPRRKDQTVQMPGGRQHWRPTSPIFRQHALRLVRKLATRYGAHPAVVAWHVNNELGGDNVHDFSLDSQAGFRTWLVQKYGTIGELNKAWGTAFWSSIFRSFEEITPPDSQWTNTTQQLDWTRYSSDALKDYLAAEVDLLHELSPGVPVTTNYMIFLGTKNMDVASWKVDFVSNDHYRSYRADMRDELSFAASLCSGVAHGYPWWLMEHSTSAVSPRHINLVKRPGELAQDSLTHVAHGADAVCFFQWRQSLAGPERYHSAMLPHAGPSSQLFRDVVALGQHLQQLGPVVGSRKVRAPIAILVDFDSRHACEFRVQPSTLVNYSQEVLDWFVAFLDLGIRVDVLPSSSDFAPYAIVVAPLLYVVKHELKERIGRYVSSGGHFITTYMSGIVDGSNQVYQGGMPGAFREMLGILIEELCPLLAGDEIQLDNGAAATLFSDNIRIVSKTAAVVANYASGDLQGKPAITTNTHGNGKASYVSTRLGPVGLRHVLPQFVELHSELPRQICHGEVEHVVRASETTRWDFYINRTEKDVDLSDCEGEFMLCTGTQKRRWLVPRSLAVFRTSI